MGVGLLRDDEEERISRRLSANRLFRLTAESTFNSNCWLDILRIEEGRWAPVNGRLAILPYT